MKFDKQKNPVEFIPVQDIRPVLSILEKRLPTSCHVMKEICESLDVK